MAVGSNSSTKTGKVVFWMPPSSTVRISTSRLVPQGSGDRYVISSDDERPQVHPGPRRYGESASDDQVQVGYVWSVLVATAQLHPTFPIQKRVPPLLLRLRQRYFFIHVDYVSQWVYPHLTALAYLRYHKTIFPVSKVCLS